MKNSSFHLKWGSFALGLILGIFGFLFTLFARIDRRDKIYSSLFGCAISMAINLLLIKYTSFGKESLDLIK